MHTLPHPVSFNVFSRFFPPPNFSASRDNKSLPALAEGSGKRLHLDLAPNVCHCKCKSKDRRKCKLERQNRQGALLKIKYTRRSLFWKQVVEWIKFKVVETLKRYFPKEFCARCRNLVFFSVGFDLKWSSWIGVLWQFSWEENRALNRKIRFHKMVTFSSTYCLLAIQLIT